MFFEHEMAGCAEVVSSWAIYSLFNFVDVVGTPYADLNKDLVSQANAICCKWIHTTASISYSTIAAPKSI